jgi:hypothetical protein
MVRLSEAMTVKPKTEEPQKASNSMRLSDAMRLEPVTGLAEDKGILGNLGEGFQKFFARTPQTIAKPMVVFGSYVREKGKIKEGESDPLSKNVTKAIDTLGAITNAISGGISTPIGAVIDNPLVDQKTLGNRIMTMATEATRRNEEFIKETFPEQENFTFGDKFAQGVGEGAGSLLVALGLSAVGGSGTAGVAFGANAASEGVVEALESDKSFGEAILIGTTLGVVEGGLEFWGLHGLIKNAGSIIKAPIKKAIIEILKIPAREGVQEGSQSIAGGSIRMATGLREYDGRDSLVELLQEGLFEAAIGAVVGAGASGGSVSVGLFQRQAVENELVKQGVPKDVAREGTDQIMKDAMDDVTTYMENEIGKQGELVGEIPVDISKGQQDFNSIEEFLEAQFEEDSFNQEEANKLQEQILAEVEKIQSVPQKISKAKEIINTKPVSLEKKLEKINKTFKRKETIAVKEVKAVQEEVINTIKGGRS